MEYRPDNWVIIKIDNKKDPIFYKVLGGWSGGYLDGNSWRMNSGIVSIKEDDEYYYFGGSSGSVYKCFKKSEFVRMNISGIYDQLMEKDGVECVPVEDIKL